MDKLLRSISYIFHPLLIPIAGVSFYYYISPRFVAEEIVQAKLISLFILTVILPILTFFLLKTLGKTHTIHLKTTRERVYPLALNCFILILVIKRIITASQSLELYYFFIGILISNMVCLTLAIFKFKVSIHMIAISGLFMFFIALGVQFSVNISGTLAFMAFAMGAVATSRLHLNAHTSRELIFGFFVGLIPQLVLVNFWM
ncbi:hypothetical protein [Algibacter sp. L4_22]|uniref:hypothetical protein n=1 Tax=Algibacter sp. L4_22 TaxID=2942477 RepID=UPI00201B734C|nr:hypothetical protein [Algibacter sp. L4_22]MCL5127545.1 hypothetical protein [Algibacter sp. L4_22]